MKKTRTTKTLKGIFTKILAVPLALLAALCALTALIGGIPDIIGKSGGELVAFIILTAASVLLAWSAVRLWRGSSSKGEKPSPIHHPYQLPSTFISHIHEADLIVLDTETTGLSPHNDHIIEIGIILIRDGAEIGSLSQLINPHVPISELVSIMTGITDTDLRHQPDIAEVLPQLLPQLRNLPTMGHNIGFDLRMINAAAKKLGIPTLHALRTVELMDLAKLKLPDAPRHRLSDLADYLKLSQQSHRAEDDARMTFQCHTLLSAMSTPHTSLQQQKSQQSRKQNRTKLNAVMRTRYLESTDCEPRNAQPSGEEIPAYGGVEITGEDTHQDILEKYGKGDWFWVTLTRGSIPNGERNQGEPTIIVSLDGELIGWTTPLNTSRHYHQVPEPHGVALAHVRDRQGDRRHEVRVEMPKPAAIPSREYLEACGTFGKQEEANGLIRRATLIHPGIPVNHKPRGKDMSGPVQIPIQPDIDPSLADTLREYPSGTRLWVNMHIQSDSMKLTIGNSGIGYITHEACGPFFDAAAGNKMTAIVSVNNEGQKTILTANMTVS